MNAIHRERLSASLLSQLFDSEEDVYRLSLREADRIGSGPPAVALRSVVAHAYDALEHLPTLASERRMRLGSAGSLLVDTIHRVRDALADRMEDVEHGYRRALSTLHQGVALVRLMHEAALDEGDDALAAWCERWLEVRASFVADVSRELAWFAAVAPLAHAA